MSSGQAFATCKQRRESGEPLQLMLFGPPKNGPENFKDVSNYFSVL